MIQLPVAQTLIPCSYRNVLRIWKYYTIRMGKSQREKIKDSLDIVTDILCLIYQTGISDYLDSLTLLSVIGQWSSDSVVNRSIICAVIAT